jgi:dTDP-4-dehydrorhamnose reductase
MRTAVLGAAGQLGRDLCPRLPGEVIPLGRADADLIDAVRLREALTSKRPDVVINCAAYNFVDRAESEPDVAFAVNARAVRDLAMICRDLDCTLVHFSSDYVFGLDETRRVPYAESDAPAPVCAYGVSKLAGEYFVRAICPKHYVIRTCGLYGVSGSGGKGGNFVETMLRLAGEKKPIRVVSDQRCTPSFTADVAVATIDLIGKGQFGLYHVTNGGDCTWFDLAREVFMAAGVPADLTPITSAEFGAPARRPAYSVLSNEGLMKVGISAPRHWSGGLRAYFRARAAGTTSRGG